MAAGALGGTVGLDQRDRVPIVSGRMPQWMQSRCEHTFQLWWLVLYSLARLITQVQ